LQVGQQEKNPKVYSGDFEAYGDHSTYEKNAQPGQLWIPAQNGVPYGWNKLFHSFGFPWFTVTPKGYLGCYKLEHGECTMTPDSFATVALQPAIQTPAPPPQRLDAQPKWVSGPEVHNRHDLRVKPEEVTNSGLLI
jgi:hypothetical protein